MSTIKAVAKHAGVSPATVSHVINGTKRITPEVTERVRQAISEIDYRPNSVARALRTGKSRTLGLIVPDITNPFFPQLAQAVEAQARAKGYATVLLESSYQADTEERGVDFLVSRGVDGLIWTLSGSDRLPAAPPRIPTVILDYAPVDWASVRADDYGGGKMQARFALETGHKNVVLLWGMLSVTSIQERRRGFHDESAGRLNVVEELYTPFSLDLPKAIQRKLVSRRGAYSFLACGNDVLAVGAIKALKAAQMGVPDDVSVIGFDETPLATIVDPPLTTVAQPTKKLGTLAVDLLLNKIRGEASLRTSVVMPVRLIERGSTRARQQHPAGEAVGA